MKNKHRISILLWIACFLLPAIAQPLYAQKSLNQARVYINPGHGGFGANDRPLATINYAVLDTMGFFETNTDLIKAFSLRDELVEAGVGFVKMSRTKNGVVAEGDPQTTSNDLFREGDVINGVTQIVTLSAITMDVQANNMDYFISIHSNAATDGTSTNYPLLIYRGLDAEPGNGLTEAKNMANSAWNYIRTNGVTYHSHYTTPTSINVRGDISFYGSSSTFNGFTGYLGVLKHGVDGFLSEGCFHTYHPERHRLLNDDYCKQEGVRYSRAIRAWFGDTSSKTTGDIMGTVKDKYRTLEHNLYKYAANSVDAYLPLNGVTVTLKDMNDNFIADYTTDNEYNGIYVFSNLAPGTYKLVYDFADTDYIAATAEIEVKTNETSFINQLVTDQETPPDYPFLDPYYPNPDQPGDIAAPETFTLQKTSELLDVDVLQERVIRRAILRDGKYFILSENSSKSPAIMVVDADDGSYISSLSTKGVDPSGFEAKEPLHILSDMAFTNDGALIATNSNVVGKESNAFQTGDFNVYKWQPTETESVEDVDPVLLKKLPTNTSESLAASGNNNSNLVANSIAVKGSSDDFYLYFDSHAGNDWTTAYNFRLVGWKITNNDLVSTQWNNSPYTSTIFGETHRLTYSPFGDIESEDEKDNLHRFVVDGVISYPTELKLSWTSNTATDMGVMSSDIPIKSSGLNFFRYLNKTYMTTVICEEVSGNYDYKLALFDVTDGINSAKLIGETEKMLIGYPTVGYMASTGIVNGQDIELHAVVDNNFFKFNNTRIEPTQTARIFASKLEVDVHTISYVLNENATEVNLILYDETNGNEVTSISLSGVNKGFNSAQIDVNDLPEGSFNWAIEAKAGNITKFVKLSDDSDMYRFAGPKGVAVDKSPESAYFGRVYITNSADGIVGSRTTNKGVYIWGADGSDISTQGNNAHTGGISWDNSAGNSPHKVAVASDGRVFISDYSLNNSGIYYMSPSDFTASSIFTGATRETTHGKLTVGSTYVGGRTSGIGVIGDGANTKIYAVDRSAAEATTWWKNTNTYNIGENTTWTTAPSTAGRSSSYFGNDNNSVVPVEGGYWGAQYRGAGGENAALPYLFYYSNAENKAVYNTYQSWSVEGSSQNGGLDINEKENLIALAFNNGAVIFKYGMEGNTPTVDEKFRAAFDGAYDDFAFDYAGNLYGVSYAGKTVSVWAMPTDNNRTVVPAKKSLLIVKTPSSTDEASYLTNYKLYPTQVKDYFTVESNKAIKQVEIYNNTGMLVMQVEGNSNTRVQVLTGELPQGVYIVRVNNEKSLKIIVQ